MNICNSVNVTDRKRMARLCTCININVWCFFGTVSITKRNTQGLPITKHATRRRRNKTFRGIKRTTSRVSVSIDTCQIFESDRPDRVEDRVKPMCSRRLEMRGWSCQSENVVCPHRWWFPPEPCSYPRQYGTLLQRTRHVPLCYPAGTAVLRKRIKWPWKRISKYYENAWNKVYKSAWKKSTKTHGQSLRKCIDLKIEDKQILC